MSFTSPIQGATTRVGGRATAVWSRARQHGFGRSPTQGDGLRRVTLRLATQTVGLLMVMLLVLEIVVYLTVRQSLLGSLEITVKGRAQQPDPTVCAALKLACGRDQRGGQPGGSRGSGSGGPGQNPTSPGAFGFGAPRADLTPSDATSVYLDRRLHVIHADGALGTAFLDVQGARQTVRTHQAQCCSVDHYKGQDYLVYTMPILQHSVVVGAVQVSISEQQYQGTMASLLVTLLTVALLGLLVSAGISAVIVRRAVKPIRQSVQRQRDFVADAAHELRTPLAIQRTVAEVGLSDESIENYDGMVEQMLVENRHLTRLVDDLSLLARADSQAVTITPARMNLSALVGDTTAELEPLAEDRGSHLVVDIAADIWVLGDMMRLRQLLLVLLDNALKFTPSGGTVEVHLRAGSGRAQLEVKDSGPGIDPLDLPRIFDRFYRADKARSGEGSGLGLAIARWIVQAHGGQLQAANTVPHGAVLTTTLPIARAQGV